MQLHRSTKLSTFISLPDHQRAIHLCKHPPQRSVKLMMESVYLAVSNKLENDSVNWLVDRSDMMKNDVMSGRK